MAAPTKYVPSFSFSGYQATQPDRPLPGPRHDTEYFNIAYGLGQTIDALDDIRRDDGKLENGIVDWDSLAPGLADAISPGTPALVRVGDTPPAEPIPGQLWWESDSSRLYIYYQDSDSAAWVHIFSGPKGDIGPAGEGIYDTAAGMPGLSVPEGVNAIRTNGYSLAGDGGGALYKRVVSEPAHAGKVQSMDGAWWELAETIPTLLQVGGDRTGVTEATALITSLLSAFDRVKIPAGTWLVSTVTLVANKTLLTDGFATILQQKTGTALGTHIVDIVGSNVTLGSAKYQGNIAADTDEQGHAVFVRGVADISNILIGDVVAENIRGDAVYIGGTLTAKVNNITIGDVIANNVYRQGVSVTGGEQIRIGNISGSAVGYFMFDAEPNASSQQIDMVEVKSVRGSFVGAVSAWPQRPLRIGSIRFGQLDLNPAHAVNSTPAYAARANIDDNAVSLRNVENIIIGQLRARDFIGSVTVVLTNPGEYGCGTLDIGQIDIENCCLTEVTTRSLFQTQNCRSFRIGGGYARMISAAHRLLFGHGSGVNSTDPMQCAVEVNNVEVHGRLLWGHFGARLNGVTVHPAAGRVLNNVRLASTANVDISTLAATGVIDAIATVTNDIVLLKNQTLPAQNGYYRVNAAAPATRWSSGDVGADFPGSYAYIREGTAAAGKFFKCDSVTAPVLGTDSITFTEDAPFDGYLFENSRDCVISGCNFFFGRAGTDNINFTFIGSRVKTVHASIVWTQSVLASGALHTLIGTTFNGVAYSIGQYTRDFSRALKSGVMDLWTDSTGKLRVKTTAATTDLDGTVVGTQT